MHNCNLQLPTPKLGSFHHTLILSTPCPRVDMKGEISQGTAGLIKSQKANPETAAMQNILCLLCPARCSSPRLWVSVSHITERQSWAILGLNHTGSGLPSTSKLPPCSAKRRRAAARRCRIPPSSGRQQRQLCQDWSSAQLPRLQSCSQSSASAHSLPGQPRPSQGSRHPHGCVKTSQTSASEPHKSWLQGFLPVLSQHMHL